MKVFLTTLGCKLNESEIESWSRRFAADGHQVVGDPRDADVCVLNTCTVTHIAAHKSRQIARQLARANPSARLVLTGCFTDIAPEDAKRLPNVAFVVSNADKDRLVQQISDFKFQISDFRELPYGAFQNLVESPSPNPQSPTSRTRAFVKIQDGCNMSCTYCIIPLARGKERSRARDEIVAEVQSLVNAGYKEIILTGVQISAYVDSVIASRDAAKQSPSSEMELASSQTALLAMTRGRAHSLRDLVAAILAETDVPRLRLTSIAPWDLDDSLLDLWSDSRLCRHLHLSLQSGSDTVLRRMRRPYTTAQFARAAELAHEKIPGVGITTDIIVGFPGESDVEFEQSLRFVEQMEFSRVHVFPYSARASTTAAALPLHVADSVKESRRKQMQTVADASACAFAQRFIGQTLPVLWENTVISNQESEVNSQIALFDTRRSPLQWSGYTDNYIRVLAASDADLHNQISLACVREVQEDGGVGAELIDSTALSRYT